MIAEWKEMCHGLSKSASCPSALWWSWKWIVLVTWSSKLPFGSVLKPQRHQQLLLVIQRPPEKLQTGWNWMALEYFWHFFSAWKWMFGVCIGLWTFRGGYAFRRWGEAPHIYAVLGPKKAVIIVPGLPSFSSQAESAVFLGALMALCLCLLFWDLPLSYQKAGACQVLCVFVGTPALLGRKQTRSNRIVSRKLGSKKMTNKTNIIKPILFGVQCTFLLFLWILCSAEDTGCNSACLREFLETLPQLKGKEFQVVTGLCGSLPEDLVCLKAKRTTTTKRIGKTISVS